MPEIIAQSNQKLFTSVNSSPIFVLFLAITQKKNHGAESGWEFDCIGVKHKLQKVINDKLQEKLETSKHFVVDSEMTIGRHSVVQFATDSLSPHLIVKKLNQVVDSIKCAAKLEVAFGFAVKNVADGSCHFYHPAETNTPRKQSTLLDR